MKPDDTTLMAIYTIVTLITVQSQHFIVQFYPLSALNEWNSSHIPMSSLLLFNVFSVSHLSLAVFNNYKTTTTTTGHFCCTLILTGYKSSSVFDLYFLDFLCRK